MKALSACRSVTGPKLVDAPHVLAVLSAASFVWWLCRVHPGNLLPVAPWEFSWVEFLTTCFVLVWYGRGLARADDDERPSAARVALFLAGVTLIYAVLQTRFLYLAEHEFFLNRVQHVIMHHLGPFLIALSLPGPTLWRGMPPWARRAAVNTWLVRCLRQVQRPLPGAILFAGLVFLWLVPAVHFRAMLDWRLFSVMNWSMVVDGLLFWFLIFRDGGLSIPARIVLVLSVQLPQIALGALIAMTPRDLYGSYTLCGRVFTAIAPLLDQQIGGFIVLYGGGMMSAAAALILLRELLRAEISGVAPAAQSLYPASGTAPGGTA